MAHPGVRMRVIGCGSAVRGDDAAGLLVARRLRELGIPAREVEGELTAVLDAFEGSQDVLLVDAMAGGGRVGSVRSWDGLPAGMRRRAGTSSHGLGVAEALDLARALGRLPRRVRIYGIEAGRVDPGGAVSPAVAAAVEKLARRIAARWAGRGARRRGLARRR